MSELDTLRNHNAELLTDIKKLKKKLSEVEEEKTQLESQKNELHESLMAIRLGQPVQKIVEKVSVAPEVFIREFQAAGFKFEWENDEIFIRNTDGTPAMVGEVVTDHEGKKIVMREAKFNEKDISDLVTENWLPDDEKSKQAHDFTHLVYGSRASGADFGGYSRHTETGSEKDKPSVNFGLR